MLGEDIIRCDTTHLRDDIVELMNGRPRHHGHFAVSTFFFWMKGCMMIEDGQGCTGRFSDKHPALGSWLRKGIGYWSFGGC